MGAPGEIAEIASYMAGILETAGRRAKITRTYLNGQGISAENFKGMLQKAGVALEDDFDINDDKKLTKAVIGLQTLLKFKTEDSREGRDGIFGDRTFGALEQLTGEAKTAFMDLKGAVERHKLQRKIREGERVTYKENNKESSLTARGIALAEQECQEKVKGGKEEDSDITEMAQRKNMVDVARYVGKQVGLPAAAILAVTLRETGGRFSEDDYGDQGTTLGMGQLLEETWGKLRQKNKFKQVMGQFTDTATESIGRGRSILADLTGIAMILKKGSEVAGIAMDENTSLTEQQLIQLRFYYHTPGYFKVMQQGPSHARYTEAKTHYDKNLERYKKYAQAVRALEERLRA